MPSTNPDMAHIEALEEENRRLREENRKLREHVANAHNLWRHEFSEEVDAAAEKLFKRLSGIEVLRRAALKGAQS